MPQWADLDIKKDLWTNPDPAIVSQNVTAAENVYKNEAEGWSRFPGRKSFISLAGERWYTYYWQARDVLVAVNDDGRVYRIDRQGNVTDVTGAAVSGGRRVIFAETELELVMAAGGRIIRLGDEGPTEILSVDAPLSTHVAYIEGYLIAIEINSGRFYHSRPGAYRLWDPIDVFAADGKPDNITAAIVTDYTELLLAGPRSIEQFEPVSIGDVPFARRWTNGDGLLAPYTFTTTERGSYGINARTEFARYSQQTSTSKGDEIGTTLEAIDDWREAWAAEMLLKGQKWVVVQAPHATNAYGTKGVTLLHDYRSTAWSFLYDWDSRLATPSRWAPWSYTKIWNRHFVGVPGGIEELDTDEYCICGETQRCLVRSGHIDRFGPSRIDELRLRVKRGIGNHQSQEPPKIGLRVRRDQRNWSPVRWRSLGRPGDDMGVVHWVNLGTCEMSWQFEIVMTDRYDLQITGGKIQVERMKW